MTTSAIRTHLSQTFVVAELGSSPSTVNARATSPDGPWQTWDLLGIDKGTKAILRSAGQTKYLHEANGVVVAAEEATVFTVVTDGDTFGLRCALGWLVFEQGAADGPTYRATVRSPELPGLTDYTRLQAVTADGRVIPKPF